MYCLSLIKISSSEISRAAATFNKKKIYYTFLNATWSFRNAISYFNPKLWSTLPLELRSAKKINSFESQYIKYKFPQWSKLQISYPHNKILLQISGVNKRHSLFKVWLFLNWHLSFIFLLVYNCLQWTVLKRDVLSNTLFIQNKVVIIIIIFLRNHARLTVEASLAFWYFGVHLYVV